MSRSDYPQDGRRADQFRSRLTAVVPEGWAVRESVELFSSGGTHITATGVPVDPRLNLQGYAAAYGRHLEESCAGYAEIAIQPSTMSGGHEVLIRRFEWAPSGEAKRDQLQLYCVENGRGYTATATPEPGRFEEVEAELRGVLAGFGLTADGSPRVEDIGPQHQEHDRPGAELDATVDYSADELAAVAGLMSAPRFPGVSDEVFADLSPEAEKAALGSAQRSLLARGVIAITESGALRIASPHAELFRAAFFAEEAVLAQHRREARLLTHLYYSSPQRSVEHSIGLGHLHRLASFEAGRLTERVVEFSEIAPRPQVEARGCRLSTSQLDCLLDAGRVDDAKADAPELPGEAKDFMGALSEFMSSSRVRSLRRNGEETSGVDGELRWVDTGDRGLWLIEPTTSRLDVEGSSPPARLSIRPVPGAELVATLADYLPGTMPRTGPPHEN